MRRFNHNLLTPRVSLVRLANERFVFFNGLPPMMRSGHVTFERAARAAENQESYEVDEVA